MPVAPFTPDPGADGWGRRPPRVPPGPPNADPDGHFRPAAAGRHRTALWFLASGVFLVLLMIPLAVPMNEADDAAPYRLNDVGADTLQGWEAAPLDLADLDTRCGASGDAILPMTLEAYCVGVLGTEVDLDIAAMTGVGDTTTAARRALRAILAADMSDVAFAPVPAGDVLHPELADRTTEVLIAPMIELDAPADPGNLPDLPDYREPGMPAETRPVQYGGTGGTSGGRYTAATSLLMEGEDAVLYTVSVTGSSAEIVECSARQIVGSIRAR